MLAACQNSSAQNAAPKWDTSIFEAGVAIVDYATAQSPNAHVTVENAVPNPRLIGLREEWDEILSMNSGKHQALRAGGPSSRPRLYWANSTSTIDWPVLERINHNWCLEDGHWSNKPVVPCLCAAGIHTGSPPM